MKKIIPYGRHCLDEADIQAVCDVLRSDWLTTGPMVSRFEAEIAAYVQARYGVAVSSGTAALHCAMNALDIGPGDEVIVPPLTFAATANCVVYLGGKPVFADVEPDTLLLDPSRVLEQITEKTKAIIGVDFAGHPCNWNELRGIADHYHLSLVADGCHALGARYHENMVGSLADMTVFSFHPVKHITTGEGGMITTDEPRLNRRLRAFRSHGIDLDANKRQEKGTWYYEMTDIGYNYRLSDIQCALGLSQFQKLPEFLERRRRIAQRYDEKFHGSDYIHPLKVSGGRGHAYHLYVVRLAPSLDRTRIFQTLRNSGIGVNVHYIPVHLHPFYQKTFGTRKGQCPVAEDAYERIISLPIYPSMSDRDVDTVVESLVEAIETFHADR